MSRLEPFDNFLCILLQKTYVIPEYFFVLIINRKTQDDILTAKTKKILETSNCMLTGIGMKQQLQQYGGNSRRKQMQKNHHRISIL